MAQSESVGDPQSVDEVQHGLVNGVSATAEALASLLESLRQVLPDDADVTIRVSKSNVYKGPLDGSAELLKDDLSERQLETLQNAFNPREGSGSVRIVDADNQTIFHSKNGEIKTNKLAALQAQAQTNASENFSTVAPEPAEIDPPAVVAESANVQATAPETPSATIPSTPAAAPHDTVSIPRTAFQEPSAAEQLEKLQAQLQIQNQELLALRDRLETLGKQAFSPPQEVKTGNANLSKWLNKQRHNFADSLRNLAHKIGQSAQEKYQQHVAEPLQTAKDVVAEKVETGKQKIADSVKQATEKGGGAIATQFMDKVAAPTANALLKAMDQIGALEKHPDGSRSYSTNDITFTQDAHGSITLSRTGDRSEINPTNLTQADLSKIGAVASRVQNAQTQTQLESAQAQQSVSASVKTPEPAKQKV